MNAGKCLPDRRASVDLLHLPKLNELVMADVEDFLQKPPKRVIETKRLRLRTLSISDVDGILPIISRKEVMQWT